MDCVLCKTSMESRDVRGVEVFLCPECGGLWLDSHKLKDLTDFDLRAGRVLSCLRCSHQMHTIYHDGIELDVCPKCGSIWLDPGELEKISGMDIDAGRVLKCSACSTQLQTKMAEGVEVDVCPKCTGVFLDRGELERMSGISPHSAKKASIQDFMNDVHYVKAILALSIYRSGKHSREKAAEISGMTPEEFDQFVQRNK